MAVSIFKAPGGKAPGGGRAGFTLIETLVALAILAVVALASFNVQQQGFRSYQRTDQLTHAVFLAQQKLTEAQMSASVPGQGRVETPSGGALIWEVIIENKKLPGLQAVRVRVRALGEDSPILEVSTYVAKGNAAKGKTDGAF